MSPMSQAALLAIAAAFIFNLEAMVVKALDGVPLTTIVAVRAVGQLLWILPAFIRHPYQVLSTKHLKLNLLRGAISSASWYLYYASFTRLPLAMATVLSFSSVLFVTALAGPILGEVVRWRRWTATMLGFLGVIAIVQPWAAGALAAFGWPAAGALLAAFLGSGVVLITKVLARSERTDTIMFYIGLLTTAVSVPIALPGLAWPGWSNFGLLLLMAFAGPFGMVLWIGALRLADASAIAPLSYVRLVFAAGFGIVLFNEMLDAWLGVGAALIVGSALYITRREAKVARRPATPLAVSPLTPVQTAKPAASRASSGSGSGLEAP